MNRIAFFVEGYTEVLFLEKLLEELAGQNQVIIESRFITGGSKVPRNSSIIRVSKDTGQQYYILIINCGNDDLVKERIREEHLGLTNAGYSKIIGIRDVRPKFSYQDIQRLEANLPFLIDNSLSPVEFILSIMEIESWFLSEYTHLNRFDTNLTLDLIKSHLGFDPQNDDMQLRENPANDLNSCYSLCGKSYDKSSTQLTIDVLDYSYIYIELRSRINYLDQLLNTIEVFLSS